MSVASVRPSSVRHHQRSRKRHGEWEEIYLQALRDGHSKRTAAGVAGVTTRAAEKRAVYDEEFADQMDIAYSQGTAWLLEIAHKRIQDPNNPGDSILKHLLSCRGFNPKQVMEISGPDGAPVQMEHSAAIPIDRLSLETRRRIVQELEGSTSTNGLQGLQLEGVDQPTTIDVESRVVESSGSGDGEYRVLPLPRWEDDD